MALSDDDHQRITTEQAGVVRDLHTRHDNADGSAVCAWCVEPWPCRPATDAAVILGWDFLS
ncbi:MAG TPA: hypothetical protein VGR21_11850 [Cryptosporangiaceae bacterium]|nr:hypothetical protein [Cryptosporangiaceae bacterium]